MRPWIAPFFALAAAGASRAEPAAPVARPNLLFIEVDDLSHEYVGAFGSRLVRTPNIDSLARQGVLFRNAMAQGAMCEPSRNSLITGLYPHNLGLYRNGELAELPRGVWTLPAALQRAGYYTAWVGKSHILAPGATTSLDALKALGFDSVHATLGRRGLGAGRGAAGDWYISHLEARGLLERFEKETNRPSTLPEDDYLDGLITKTALDFMSTGPRDKPFFLWINYSVPHRPYDVNRKYLERYSAEEMPGATEPSFSAPRELVLGAGSRRSEAQLRQAQAAYCGTIAFLDDQVGRILERLRTTPLGHDTVVVFFSDQGVMMGGHGREKKGTLFRQVTQPSLIVSWPSAFARDRVVEAPVELLDLIRTSLEIARAPEEESKKRGGHSLIPLLTGQGRFEREVAFAEIEGYVAVTDGRHRLIRGRGASLLFDEVADPGNLRDISKAHPALVESLGRRIDEWLARSGPVLAPARRATADQD
jgi:arylsulfatase A-like enzyme